MSYTENKLNVLRRLLLGPLFDDCRNNPYGVSRDRLEEHVDNLKKDGCIGDCTVEDFVKMCQLKSHIPSCYNEKDRDCVEGWFEKQRGPATVAFTNYKNSKYFEDLPDDEDEEDEKEEEKECSVCGDDEDLEDNLGTEREGYRDEFKKLEKMSCNHYSHKACLIKVATGLDKDNTFCPICKVKYPITEVPMPIVSDEQKRQNALLKTITDSLATGVSLKEIAEMNLTTISGLIRGLVMNVKSFSEAIGMSEEELTNQMYALGDEIYPRVIKEYFDEDDSEIEIGTVREEYEVKWDGDNPVKDGYFKEYYQSGKLKVEAIYSNDKIEGEVKMWYENGRLKTQAFYKDNILEGEVKNWWENGRLKFQRYYKDGKIEGESKDWYENGQLYIQQYYKDNKREGKFKEWWENGRLKTQAFYKDSNLEGEVKGWYENGQLWVQMYYKNGKQVGEYKRWYENGQLSKRTYYKAGKIESR